jgi:heat shock protein HtpX
MTVLTNGLKTAALLGLLMGLCLAIGWLIGSTQGMVLGFVLGGAMAVISYFFSDRLALLSVGAREVSREQAPELHDLTARLAERAGIPMPRLYYSPEQAPNAFATGRNPAHGVVCVTEGLMNMLEPRELEGVIAHELSHIKHRDILISTMAAVLAGAISQIAWMLMWTGGGRDNRDSGNPLSLIGAILMMVLAPLAAMLIQLAISRSREYAADASGAQYAGGPEGLISALRKLELANHRIPMNINPAERHMFIVMPLTEGGGIAELFRTHPNTENRITKLLEASMAENRYAA